MAFLQLERERRINEWLRKKYALPAPIAVLAAVFLAEYSLDGNVLLKIVSLAELQDQGVSHNPNIKKRVMITAGELGKLTNFSQAVFPIGEVAPVHQHENMGEVFFVQSGEGEIRIEGKSFKLLPGVCALVEAREEHEVENTGDEELVITYFGLSID